MHVRIKGLGKYMYKKYEESTQAGVCLQMTEKTGDTCRYVLLNNIQLKIIAQNSSLFNLLT